MRHLRSIFARSASPFASPEVFDVIVWDTAKPPMEGHVRVDRAHVGGVTALEWVGADKIVSGGFDSCVKSWAV